MDGLNDDAAWSRKETKRRGWSKDSRPASRDFPFHRNGGGATRLSHLPFGPVPALSIPGTQNEKGRARYPAFLNALESGDQHSEMCVQWNWQVLQVAHVSQHVLGHVL